MSDTRANRLYPRMMAGGGSLYVRQTPRAEGPGLDTMSPEMAMRLQQSLVHQYGDAQGRLPPRVLQELLAILRESEYLESDWAREFLNGQIPRDTPDAMYRAPNNQVSPASLWSREVTARGGLNQARRMFGIR